MDDVKLKEVLKYMLESIPYTSEFNDNDYLRLDKMIDDL